MSFNAESLPVELNGISYLLDTAAYRRTTVPVSRQQRDNSKEPGENTLDTTGSWVRSQTDWSYGAGQLYLDNEDSDRRRFYSSDGIDIWTKGQVTLLPTTEPVATTGLLGTEDLIIERFVNGTDGTEYLYLAHDSTVHYSTDGGTTWDVSGVISAAAIVTSMTCDGTNVYLALTGTNAPEKYILGATANLTYGTETPDLLQVAAGRMIGAYENSIYELDSAGAKASSSLDYSLPLASSRWISVTAAANGIYVAANTDNTGSIYYVGVNNADGTLRTTTIAASLPRNETINAIIAYGGVLGLATSTGFRLGLIDQQSSGVTIGPAIDTGGAAFSLEVDSQFMWWGCNYAQVYRADLARFTETLVPVYAADLKMSSGIVTDDKVVSLARLNNSKLFLAINKETGPGVLYRESYTNEKLAEGSFVAGEITWSTVVPKLLRSGVIDLDRSQFERTSIDYRATGVAYDASTYEYRFGLPTSEAAGEIRLTATNNADIGSTLLDMVTQVPQTFDFGTSSKTAISYDLTGTLLRSTSDPTVAPILHDWQLTAVAVPRRIDEIIIPIVLRRSVLTARNSGAPASFVAGNVFTALRALMENGTAVTYVEGARTDTVTIERLEMQPERLSDDGSWWEGTLIARLLTVPI